MKLCEDDIAPNCRRMRIFMAEKGVEIKGEKLRIGGDKNVTED